MRSVCGVVSVQIYGLFLANQIRILETINKPTIREVFFSKNSLHHKSTFKKVGNGAISIRKDSKHIPCCYKRSILKKLSKSWSRSLHIVLAAKIANESQ
jgi:hypothetical protein